MSYVDHSLIRDESIMIKAKLSGSILFLRWLYAIFFFWLLLIPVRDAIRTTLFYFTSELALTNKRVVGKCGFLNTATLECPLSRVQNVAVYQNVWGMLFGYATIEIEIIGQNFIMPYVRNAVAFKKAVFNRLAEIEGY